MRKLFYIFCLSLVLSFSATAQIGVRTITIDDAVNLALQNNLEIKQSKMDLEVLAAKKKYSWNSISPSVSASGSFNGNTPLGNGDTSLSYSLGASISATLTPSVRTTMKQAELNYKAGEADLERIKRKVELNVRKSFYRLVYFNENLETQQRSLETTKQTYESNLVKYKQGRLPELNLLKSQFAYESKIPDIENLKRTYQSDIDSFKLLLGLELSEMIALEGKLDDAVESHIDESVLQLSLDNNSDIKGIKQQILSTQNSIQAEKLRTYAPSVSISVSERTSGSNSKMSVTGYEYRVKTEKVKDENGKIIKDKDGKEKVVVVTERINGEDYPIYQPTETGSIVTKKAWKPSSGLTYDISVRIPLDGLFPWSSGKINIQSADVSLEKQKQNLEQTRIRTSLTVENGYNTILQAKKQLELLEKSVELAQKTYDMSKNAYNMGSADLLSLQQAEDDLYSAKYKVQNQKYTILTSILDLEDTLGLPYGTLGK